MDVALHGKAHQPLAGIVDRPRDRFLAAPAFLAAAHRGQNPVGLVPGGALGGGDDRTHRDVEARRTAVGRAPGFNVSVRPIIAATEGAAWDKANRILAAMSGGKKGWSRQETIAGPVDNAGKRLMRFAMESDIHDERLWMPIARATGALGNTSCLVGTAEQVADALLRYYRLGVASFLIRGFDPQNDTVDFGRELIPRVKAGAVDIDRLQAAE